MKIVENYPRITQDYCSFFILLLNGVGSIYSGSLIGVLLFLCAVYEKLFKNGGWGDFADGYGPCGTLGHQCRVFVFDDILMRRRVLDWPLFNVRAFVNYFSLIVFLYVFRFLVFRLFLLSYLIKDGIKDLF